MIIVTILGKSGCGKSTLEKQFEDNGYNRLISYTTRDMRAGEEQDREYHFVTRERFKELVNSGAIVEQVVYNNNLYGSPGVDGHDRNVAVVESDGLEKLTEIYKDSIFSVYIKVSDEEIERRLNKRNNTTDIRARKLEDNKKFDNIQSKVTLVVDGNNSPSDIFRIISEEISRRNI